VNLVLNKSSSSPLTVVEHPQRPGCRRQSLLPPLIDSAAIILDASDTGNAAFAKKNNQFSLARHPSLFVSLSQP
jgi:hypothetical protein